jgi:hypothetical protein
MNSAQVQALFATIYAKNLIPKRIDLIATHRLTA